MTFISLFPPSVQSVKSVVIYSAEFKTKSPRGGWLLVVLLLAFLRAEAGTHPLVVKLPGLPDQANELSWIVPGPTGALICTKGGYLQQFGLEWRKFSPESPHGTYQCRPFANGVVLFGSRLMLHLNQKEWREIPTNDQFETALPLAGSVYLAGLRSVLRVGPDGQVTDVHTFTPAVGQSSIRLIDGHVILHAFSPNAVWELVGEKFVPAPERFQFADWSRRQYWIGEGAVSGYYFDGVHRTPDPEERRTEAAVLAHLWSDRIRTAAGVKHQQIGKTLYRVSPNGLQAYSLGNGELLWDLGMEYFDGGLSNIMETEGNLLICSNTSLFQIVDPGYVASATLPSGSQLNGAQSGDRTLLVNSSGAFYPEGERVDCPLPHARALAVLSTGEVLWFNNRNSFLWDGQPVKIPDVKGELTSSAEVGDGRVGLVFFLNDPEVLTFDKLGRVGRLPLPDPGIEMAWDLPTQTILVGTMKEGVVLAKDGTWLRRFGNRPMMVFTHQGRAMYSDIDRNWFDITGRLIGRLPLQFSNLATDWQGRLVLCGRMADGKNWAGLADPATGGWRTLDIPLPDLPLYLGEDRGRLLFVTKDKSLFISEPRYLPEPRAELTIRTKSGVWAPGMTLGPEEDQIDIVLPPPRLSPWRNPEYELRVNGGSWQKVESGGSLTIPRLSWGGNRLEFKAYWADLKATASYELQRRWPWWARWPGWLLYGATLGCSGFALVRWRTRRFERRTQDLENIVVLRMKELSAAKAELESANQMKSRFIASMNHEIRNPINGILGLTRMLEEGEADPRRQTLLLSLEACTEQLRSTMDDVLDFRALEKGGVALAEEAFELGALLRGACAAADLEGGRISLLQLPPAPVQLLGDQGKLRQILGNYLSNVLKYGLPPRGEVEAECREAEDGRRWVTVRVRNLGPTIPREELNQLFTIFYRGARARTSSISGTGLGLAVCRRLAEAMGGSTGASSADGLTTFWVTVPFTPARIAALPAAAPAVAQFSGRVLATEDEVYNRLVLGHYLQRMGFTVDWADRGAMALTLAHERPYRLIITDWFLPDMDGGSLIRQLRENLGAAMPPVMVISAYATIEKKQEALAAGAQLFVTKPVDERKLRLALAELTLGPAPGPELELAPSGDGACDFSALDALGERKVMVGNFMQEVNVAWDRVVHLWPTERGRARDLVHRLRSQMLLVRAEIIADQLMLLEKALLEDWTADEIILLVEGVARELADLRAAAAKLS